MQGFFTGGKAIHWVWFGQFVMLLGSSVTLNVKMISGCVQDLHWRLRWLYIGGQREG
jgi:hypothetical protein